MKTIIKQNNTAIMQRLVKEINALPPYQIEVDNAKVMVHNPDFNEKIVELTENQIINYKLAINAVCCQ